MLKAVRLWLFNKQHHTISNRKISERLLDGGYVTNNTCGSKPQNENVSELKRNFCMFQKLMEDRIILQKRRDNFKKMIQGLTVRYEGLKSQLNENETYSQVDRISALFFVLISLKVLIFVNFENQQILKIKLYW